MSRMCKFYEQIKINFIKKQSFVLLQKINKNNILVENYILIIH